MCERSWDEEHSSRELYTQCRLSKKIAAGVSEQTSFIPAKFAKLGGVLKLRDANGVWDDGWVVESVGATRTEDVVDTIGRFSFGSTKSKGKKKR